MTVFINEQIDNNKVLTPEFNEFQLHNVFSIPEFRLLLPNFKHKIMNLSLLKEI